MAGRREHHGRGGRAEVTVSGRITGSRVKTGTIDHHVGTCQRTTDWVAHRL